MWRGLLVGLVGLSAASACTNDFDLYEPRGAGSDGGTPADTAVATCTGPSAKLVTGHCYFLTGSALGWSAANEECKATGAHLASATSGDEQTAIEGIGSGDRWIGLSRPAGSQSVAGSFRWVSGEVVSYFKWSSGEPSGAGECGRVLAAGAWAYHPCSSALLGVCERD